jgi:hypothetical protein
MSQITRRTRPARTVPIQVKKAAVPIAITSPDARELVFGAWPSTRAPAVTCQAWAASWAVRDGGEPPASRVRRNGDQVRTPISTARTEKRIGGAIGRIMAGRGSAGVASFLARIEEGGDD